MKALDPSEPRLTYVRIIRAAPPAVFQAFVDPREILHWWGPDEGPTLSAETDVRVGGSFRVAFKTMDGVHHESRGEYLEIDPPRRLVMTWWWSATPSAKSRVTVSIEPSAEGAQLTVVHEGFKDDDSRVTHEIGWAGAIEKMARRLEGVRGEEES